MKRKNCRQTLSDDAIVSKARMFATFLSIFDGTMADFCIIV